MSSNHSMSHRNPATTPDASRRSDDRQRVAYDRNRPLPPPPPSSLPTEYEIPTLRRKPTPQQESVQSAGHTRSLSHPFPSLFNGKKQEKKPHQRQTEVDSSEDGSIRRSKDTPRLQSRSKSKNGTQPTSTASKQPATGKCMTCASTVRWPQDLKVFRCTTCLTINDLEPAEAQAVHNTNGGAFMSATIQISLERTRKMIDRCIIDHLQSVLEGELNLTPADTRPDAFDLTDEDEFNRIESQSPVKNHQREDQHVSGTPIMHRRPSGPKFATTPQIRRTASSNNNTVTPSRQNQSYLRDQNLKSSPQTHVPLSRLSPEVTVFRNVESYLATCLTGCTTLNSSFFSAKSNSSKLERADTYPLHRRPSELASTPTVEPDVFLSGLDAKMLLLGDVVENGSWWTGKVEVDEDAHAEASGDRAPEKWRGVISARSPRINWRDLAEWYRLILQAGDDWRKHWDSFRFRLDDQKLKRWQSISLDVLHQHFVDSQIHLQRTFLKATENLLKRPRRPLKSPEDCRFLIMLLANPMLSPVSSVLVPKASSIGSTSVNHSVRANHGEISGLGRHAGIIKRILGLLAHLSNDVHLYLISWFTRFSDSHFSGLVDLVGAFVTYRLTRQLNKPFQEEIDPTGGLIPSFSGGGVRHASQMHDALGRRSNNTQKQNRDGKPRLAVYSEDWQVQAAARVMALFFQSNTSHSSRKRDTSISPEQRARSAGLSAKHQAYMHGQMIPVSNFYNSMLDHADLIADFEAWEVTKTKFTFCQYPFFLSIWAKIHILEHDARRQMESKAREAFFDSILSRKAVSQYLVLKVRRDCLVEDSLKSVSEAIGRGGSDVKKGLRIDFVGEEGVDAGGLRKEWFLLLVREIFNPNHGLFTYDDESQYCYFNPFCFESSEQFFLVGVLLGLAIYNSTILDVDFPPFLFKKMLASAPPTSDKLTSTPKISHQYTLEDLAELKPSLARGLRHLLEFDGDVQEVFCRDFVIEMERYGSNVQIPLCTGGLKKPVTNSNRREFVDLYVHYLLDQSVARQYEPFKRGFFTVCGGNALSLFRPEEIELLIRGSDEPLNVSSLRAVATYDGWSKDMVPQDQPQVIWFWDFFEKISPADQRKMLSFITGGDRIPAMGATNLVIRIQLLLDKAADDAGFESQRLPIARTCFNMLGLYRYHQQATLESKLWTAVTSSEGFGLK